MVQAKVTSIHQLAIRTHKKVPVPNYHSYLLVCACCSPKFDSEFLRARHLHFFCSAFRVLYWLRVIVRSLHLAFRLRYVCWIRLSLLQYPKAIQQQREGSVFTRGRHDRFFGPLNRHIKVRIGKWWKKRKDTLLLEADHHRHGYSYNEHFHRRRDHFIS